MADESPTVLDDLRSKLTPAAEQALQEIVNEYSTQILTRAGESSSEIGGEIREISVRDLIEGLHRTQIRARGRTPTFTDRVLRMYAFAGFAIGVTGLVGYTMIRFAQSGSMESLFLLVGVIGGAMAIVSLLSSYLKLWPSSHRAYQPAPESLGEERAIGFLKAWSELELSMRSAVSAALGESAADRPVGELLRALGNTSTLSASEIKQLNSLLMTRNALVHGSARLRAEDVDSAIETARKLKPRIEQAL